MSNMSKSNLKKFFNIDNFAKVFYPRDRSKPHRSQCSMYKLVRDTRMKPNSEFNKSFMQLEATNS